MSAKKSGALPKAWANQAPDLRTLYQDVLLKRATLDDAVAALADPGEKHLAYEMAVGVCDAMAG